MMVVKSGKKGNSLENAVFSRLSESVEMLRILQHVFLIHIARFAPESRRAERANP